MSVYTVRYVVRVIYDEVEADSPQEAAAIIREDIKSTMGVPDEHFDDHETAVFDQDHTMVWTGE